MSGRVQSTLSRRAVLIGGAAATGATMLTPLTAEAAWISADVQGVRVLLHDRRMAPDAALTHRLQAQGARIVLLGEDPVRQWRDQSAAWLARSDARLMGITRWHDFLMLRGLAAETRRHVRFASPVSDEGVLTWLIA
jgi:hypothetical protein